MDEKIGGPDLATPLAQVESELCTLAGQIAAATCRFLELLAEFDRREGWAGAGIMSCAHWLSWRCGIDLRTAREHVRVARSLVDLPIVRKTFSEGRLSYSKVRAIARVATDTNEKDLVDAGLHAPAATLERLVQGLRTAASNARKEAKKGVRARGVRPDGSVPGMPKPQENADDDRMYLQWRWDDEGRLVLWGRLDAVEGASFLAAAARVGAVLAADANGSAEPPASEPPASEPPASEPPASEPPASEPPASEPSCPPSADCRPPSNLAPALVAMAQTALTNSDLPRFAPAAEVTVLVGIDELQQALAESDPDADAESDAESDAQSDADGAAPTRLQDGPALKRAALRRLVDDGRLRTAVLAGDGRTLDLGRRSRRLTKPQLVTLWRRDGGCRAPGCSRSRFLHAHHVRFWSRGGPSDLDNLVLLCGEHHRQLHLGLFMIAALGEQRFAFRLPDGTPWLAAPPMRGDAQDLSDAHADVTDRTTTPDWDGRRLDLGAAVSTYLDSWAAGQKRSA